MSTTVFSNGNNYTFSTYAPNILGSNFRNLELVGVVSYEIASTFTNVATKHAAVLASLPVASEKDPSKLEYLIFKSSADSKLVLATSWINMATVESALAVKIICEVQDVSPAAVDHLRQLLSSAGYKKFTTTVENLGK